MLEEYDIDRLNPRPNPYAKELKKQITIKIAPSVIDYFKGESQETGRIKAVPKENQEAADTDGTYVRAAEYYGGGASDDQ